MGPTPKPTALQRFMVTATIRDSTSLAELAASTADEELLELPIGAHDPLRARRTVHLEVIATDEEHVLETLSTQPFKLIFDIDVSSIAPRDLADPAVRTQF